MAQVVTDYFSAATQPPSAPVPGQSPAELLRVVRNLSAALRNILVRSYEESPVEVVRSQLLPVVTEKLAELAALAETIESIPDGAASIQDCAFMVRMELGQRRKRLLHLESSLDSADLLAGCDSALRSTVRGIRALAGAMGARESVFGYRDADLVVALRVRRAFANLRLEIEMLENAEATESSVRSLLLRARLILAILRCSEEYDLMRVGDRMQLRVLQDRILGWLKAHEAEPREGIRIWSDLLGFARLVHQINRREVLVEHDRRVVGQLIADCSGSFTDACVDLLSKLFGLDPALDEVMLTIDPVDTTAARAELNRLALQFGFDAHF